MINDKEQINELKKFYEIDPTAPYYPTGVTLLDEVVGGGLGLGYAGGKFVNLAGDTGTSKSYIAWHTIVANIHYWKQQGIPFKWIYDDSEYGSTFDIEAIYGLELSPENLTNSETVEQAHASISNFLNSLKEGEKGIYVLDSLDPLKTEAEIKAVEDDIDNINKGKKVERGSYEVAKQKYLSSRLFPQITGLLNTTKALVIIISQVRYNLSPMGPQFTIGGGKAAEHYYNTRVLLSRQADHTITRQGNQLDIGMGVKAQLKKNKCPRPNRSCQFDIFYTRGVDDIGACIDFLAGGKTPTGLKAKGGKYEWDEVAFPNKDEMYNFIVNNKLVKELRNKTIERWEELEALAKEEAAKRVPQQDWGY